MTIEGRTPITHSAVAISTNRDAREAAAVSVSGPRWFLADVQTGGEGRRGRAWQHLAGNMAASLLWPATEADFQTPAVFSFLAGLAALDALDSLGFPGDQIGLKWPNDLILLGRKFGGILVERVATPAGPSVIIGMGINLAKAPDLGGVPTAALAEAFGRTIPPIDLLPLIDAAFQRRWHAFRAHGFAPVRTAYLERVTGLGGPLTVMQAHRRDEGLFAGIDDDGALLLQLGDAVTRVVAGEIFLGPAASLPSADMSP